MRSVVDFKMSKHGQSFPSGESFLLWLNHLCSFIESMQFLFKPDLLYQTLSSFEVMNNLFMFKPQCPVICNHFYVHSVFSGKNIFCCGLKIVYSENYAKHLTFSMRIIVC